MTPQVVEKCVTVAALGDDQLVVNSVRDDSMGVVCHVLGVPVGHEGVVARDPERRERPDVIGERLGIAETSVELLDLLDGEHAATLAARSAPFRPIPRTRAGDGRCLQPLGGRRSYVDWRSVSTYPNEPADYPDLSRHQTPEFARYRLPAALIGVRPDRSGAGRPPAAEAGQPDVGGARSARAVEHCVSRRRVGPRQHAAAEDAAVAREKGTWIVA